MAVAVSPLRAAEARPLALDPARCVLEVEVHATFDTFVVRLERFAADIRVDRAARRVARAEFSFDIADLRTGIARRDEDLLAWEDHARFPRVNFQLDGMEPQPDGSFLARGTVMLHGLAHGVAVSLSVLAEGDRFVLAGEATVDLRDFGLPPPRKYLLVRVNPRLRVRFHLQGRIAGIGLPQDGGRE